MNTNLSNIAGFPLEINLETMTFQSDPEIGFVRESRTADQIREVLYAPDAVSPDQILFYIDHLEVAAGSTREIFDRFGLTYGFTILRPGTIGREFIKNSWAHSSANSWDCINLSGNLCPNSWNHVAIPAKK